MHGSLLLSVWSVLWLSLSACGRDEKDSAEESVPQVGALSAELHGAIPSLVYARWEQLHPGTVHVEYSVDPEVWMRSPSQTVEAGPQEQLLLGIPYDTTASWRVVSDPGDGTGPVTSAVQEITTGPLPEDQPVATVLVSNPDAWEPTGNYLYTSIADRNYVMSRFIMDRQGRVVWSQQNARANATFYARISYDGDDLLYDRVDLLGGGGNERVYRIKIDGTVVGEYGTPGLHHAFTELPDESIVWGRYGADVESERLEKRLPDGTMETLWESTPGWTSNAIFWNEAADTFLYSFYTHMTVVEIDHATGAVLHQWGQEGDWAFDPVESLFDWQHGVTMTDAGTLLLSTHVSLSSMEGVVREYVLREDTQTLEEIWSFGVGDGIEAPYYGEAHRLPGGNTLQNYGTNVRLREATPEGEVVWDVEWVDGQGRRCELIGRSVFIEDLYDFAP